MIDPVFLPQTVYDSFLVGIHHGAWLARQMRDRVIDATTQQGEPYEMTKRWGSND